VEVETTAGLAGVRCVISTESVRRYRLDDASESGFASVIEPLREMTECHESAAAHESGHPLSLRWSLPDPCLLPEQCQRVLRRYNGFTVVHTTVLTLKQHIDSPPDRVQETRKREIEKSQHEILRRCRCHEPLDRLVAALNVPAFPIFCDRAGVAVSHKHGVLPVIRPV